MRQLAVVFSPLIKSKTRLYSQIFYIQNDILFKTSASGLVLKIVMGESANIRIHKKPTVSS